MHRFDGDQSPSRISAAELRATVIRGTRFREGYNVSQVDRLLADAAQSLELKERGQVPSMSAEQVLNVRFEATKFRPGYDQDEVDDLLDRVIHALR